MTDTRMLHDRVVILTGAGGGLGVAMAKGLLGAGARLAAYDRSGAASRSLGGLVGPDRLLTQKLDVSDEAACEVAVAHVLDTFGTIDVLVNLAGITGEQPENGAFPRFWERDPENWRAVQAINHGGTFNMAYYAIRPMLAQGFGRIINISTSLTTMTNAGMGAYGPSKAAIEASTSIWAKELAGTGVTANVLLPGGPVNTPSVPASWPRDQLLEADVMVPPLLWLASDASAGTTGRRFIAKEWDASRADADQVVHAAPAGWGPA